MTYTVSTRPFFFNFDFHYFFHKNHHLKYHSFPKTSWRHGQLIRSRNQCRNCCFLFRFQCARHFKFRACSRTKSKLITSQSEFPIFPFVQKEQNVRMTFKWHIWLVIDSWSLTAPIRNSVRGRTEFCKITMTSGRRNLPFLTPTLLLIFDRRPLPWYSL